MTCSFGDINQDPIRRTEVALKEILPAAQAQTIRNIASIGGRITGIVIQYYEGVDAQPESYHNYLIDERSLNTFWENGLYAGAMKDCQIIIDQAEKEGQAHYMGIAKTLMAFNLGILTSYWGDVPYREAFQGINNLQVAYNTQNQIYEVIQHLLDEAIVALSEPKSEISPKEDDLIFEGDAVKWIGIAWALKARYYLQLSKRDEEVARNVLDAIASGAFINAVDQGLFQFGNTLNEANPFPLFNIERPDQLILGACLLGLLEEQSDPRLEKYAIQSNDIWKVYQEESELYWSRLHAPLALISFTELKFIEAEALLRLDRMIEAEAVFKEAVIAHLEQMEIPFEKYSSFVQEKIHFNELNTFAEKLKRLIQQKYIALYVQGNNEAWVDYRRTGYPELTPPPEANTSFNPSLVIPRRYLYPVSERNSNRENLDEAIERQGGHLMDVALWAFH